MAAVRQAESDDPRRARALQAGGHLAADLTVLRVPAEGDVSWVEGPDRAPVVRVAPIDVAAALSARLWGGVTAVLTSATVPAGLPARLGMPEEKTDELDVGSPFAYETQALLYCAAHLPDPRQPGYEAMMHDELAWLIGAARGRTMALFTSWRAMRAAAEAVRARIDYPVLLQDDLPKPALVARFGAEESSCLFATMGFWQGVDIPGPSLSMVVIDRIPFARPDEPLQAARRERAGPRAVRDRRPAAGGDAAGPGRGTADPHRVGPRRRGRARPPPRVPRRTGGSWCTRCHRCVVPAAVTTWPPSSQTTPGLARRPPGLPGYARQAQTTPGGGRRAQTTPGRARRTPRLLSRPCSNAGGERRPAIRRRGRCRVLGRRLPAGLGAARTAHRTLATAPRPAPARTWAATCAAD